jgi:hypothetical protein
VQFVILSISKGLLFSDSPRLQDTLPTERMDVSEVIKRGDELNHEQKVQECFDLLKVLRDAARDSNAL